MAGSAAPAQGIETLKKASESFKDYSQGQGETALVVAALLAVVVLVMVLYSIAPPRRQVAQWRLFRRFAEANRLTDGEARLLQYVAERAQPDNPAAIFVKRSLFEGAVADLGVDASRAAVLRRKVYGP